MMKNRKLDFDRVTETIRAALADIAHAGLSPGRVYMNTNTYHSLMSTFHERVITIVPDGMHRRPTIYGVKIAISDDLGDYEVDASVRIVN